MANSKILWKKIRVAFLLIICCSGVYVLYTRFLDAANIYAEYKSINAPGMGFELLGFFVTLGLFVFMFIDLLSTIKFLRNRNRKADE